MNVQDLKTCLTEMLSKLENIDDDTVVSGINRIRLNVCNIDGEDVLHEQTTDKVVNFVDVEVSLSRD